tara:strand:- start:1020 stop:1871 length:852 start_codon:yes stop_codon:yes gene_type:complete
MVTVTNNNLNKNTSEEKKDINSKIEIEQVSDNEDVDVDAELDQVDIDGEENTDNEEEEDDDDEDEEDDEDDEDDDEDEDDDAIQDEELDENEGLEIDEEPSTANVDPNKANTSKLTKQPKISNNIVDFIPATEIGDENIPSTEIISDSESDDDMYDENYLKKIDAHVKEDYISSFHPEELSVNFNEVLSLSKVVRNKDGIVIDPLHKTVPILTKYEYTSILGTRTKQINSGAKPFIEVKKQIIDGYIIAEMELKQKKLPFIVQRPLPNGGCEYWPLQELEILV